MAINQIKAEFTTARLICGHNYCIFQHDIFSVYFELFKKKHYSLKIRFQMKCTSLKINLKKRVEELRTTCDTKYVHKKTTTKASKISASDVLFAENWLTPFSEKPKTLIERQLSQQNLGKFQ